MKRRISVLVIFGLFGLLFTSLKNDGGSDKTSEKISEVKIGEQIWMSGNLSVEHFRNGDPIPQAKSKKQWRKAGKEGKPAWCYYGLDPYIGEKYGKLYNWYAINDPRGLAPKGWRIPSSDDWNTLVEFLGGKSPAGIALKAKSDWKGKIGSNSSGFGGAPGGFRNAEGIFTFLGDYGKWWTISTDDPSNAWCQYLYKGYDMCMKYYLNKAYGLSVRCIKD